MSGARKRKHREACPRAWDLAGTQPVALHQPFGNDDPSHSTHSAVEAIRRICEGSLSHNKHQTWTFPTSPQGLQGSYTASLVELLHTPNSDESWQNIPLTRQSGVQRVVRIPIDRPDRGNLSPDIIDAKKQAVTFNKKHKVAKQAKSASFPEKLYAILAEPDLADVVAWTAHGTSWRVLQANYLQEFVLPRYFRSERYTSFMRQVTGWGFTRHTEGPEMHSYYHPLFIRGRPDLVKEMRRPQKASDDSSLSSKASLLPTVSHFQRTQGVPPFHMDRYDSPKIEIGTYATSSFEGEFRGTVQGHNYGNMRDDPAWNRLSLQESQSPGWDQLQGVTSHSRAPDAPQALSSSYPLSEASPHIFGGSSGDESDEEFQKLLDSTDRLLGAALRAQLESEDESPETSPLPMSREGSNSMLRSFSFPTPSGLPSLQNHPCTDHEETAQTNTPRMPNL